MALGYSNVWPCDVPVFRYALERWPAEIYEVVVFHRGSLSAEDREIVSWLENSSAKKLAYANCIVREIDLGSLPEGPVKALWESLANPELPCLAVRYPNNLIPGQSIWSGPLSAASAGAIIDSPARREIVRWILGGESAVWVLVDSGDPEKDNRAASLLREELPRLEKTLKLPPAVDRVSATGAPDLKVGFSMLRLSRSDPEEEALARMLTCSESDLEQYTSWPMAFPVYGRGRVLYALVGDGISEENILEACAFLVGPCACELKGQNPGLDLLLPVDWEAGINGSWVEEIGLPPLVGLAGLADPSPGQGSGTGSGEPQGHLYRNILLALGLVLLVIALISLRIVKSQKQG